MRRRKEQWIETDAYKRLERDKMIEIIERTFLVPTGR